MAVKTKSALADKRMILRAVRDSFIKLSPRAQAKNPVMLLVYLSGILTTVLWIASLWGIQDAPSGYTLAVAVILWLTVLFAISRRPLRRGVERRRPLPFARPKRLWRRIGFPPPTVRRERRGFLRFPQERGFGYRTGR